jgi:2-keto-4-pentenoate hydratase/2-oxohepta-3-ene-1,7-dioic acid hydratase in catechol pathway
LHRDVGLIHWEPRPKQCGARPAGAGKLFYQMKSRDTFASIGPYTVTVGRSQSG